MYSCGMATDDPLAILAAHVQNIEQLQKLTPYLIRQCRQQGTPWETVAGALGVSRQEASRRWGPVMRSMDEFTAQMQLPPAKAGPTPPEP